MPKTKKEKKVESSQEQEVEQESSQEQKVVQKVEPEKVLNPKTNRLVKVGGKAHKNMMKGDEKKK